MLQVYSLASGSAGNCIYIKYGETSFLVDAGISYHRIKKAIASLGDSIDALQGVLITHDHSDHTRGVEGLLKKHTIPVYTTLATATVLYASSPCRERMTACVRTVDFGYSYDVGEVYFIPFPTPHDAAGSVGFRIVCPNGDTIGIATDVGCVTSQVAKGLTGCNVVILESNHDPDMLWTGPYPSHLKKRVASDVGHLSNQACGELLSTLIKTGTTDVALFHLSKENNTERIAMETVRCAIIGCGEDPDKVCIKIAKEKETVQVV